jgi:hypothetical protein
MRRVAAVLALCAIASCGTEGSTTCTRHSDCPPGNICSASSQCEPPPDAAPADGNEGTTP